MPKSFKSRDFLKLFGRERKSIDGNGKEYRKVKILSSKLLKAKEQIKEKGDKNKSVLETLRILRLKKKISYMKS